MKRWIELAAQLYPSAWRKRYGSEFDALLQQLRPGWRELLNVLGGALKMQLSGAAVYVKFGVAFAVLGAIAAGVGSFALPREYVSAAVLRITPLDGHLDLEPFVQVEQEVLSRSSLSAFIQDPSLDLYRRERMREPLEDVIVRMRSQDIQVAVTGNSDGTATCRITFRYPDQRKAQATVKALIGKFTRTMVRQADINEHMRGAVPIRQNLEVVDPPNLPWIAVGPNRLQTTLVGLACGLVLGIVVALFSRRPRRALAVVSLGLGGCLAGAGISFFLSPRYVSRAAMRIVPYDRLAGSEKGREWLIRIAAKVNSRESLTELITNPALDLYRDERAHRPLEEVLERVRERDLHIGLTPEGTALQLEFGYSDPGKSQAMLQAVIRRVITVSLADIQGTDRPGSELRYGVVEILDNASLPLSRKRPTGLAMAAVSGLGGGLMAGWTLLSLRRRRQVGVAAV